MAFLRDNSLAELIVALPVIIFLFCALCKFHRESVLLMQI